MVSKLTYQIRNEYLAVKLQGHVWIGRDAFWDRERNDRCVSSELKEVTGCGWYEGTISGTELLEERIFNGWKFDINIAHVHLFQLPRLWTVYW